MNLLVPDSIVEKIKDLDPFTFRISQREAYEWVQEILDHISILFDEEYEIQCTVGNIAISVHARIKTRRTGSPFPILVLTRSSYTNLYRISDVCYVYQLGIAGLTPRDWIKRQGDNLAESVSSRSLSGIGLFASAAQGRSTRAQIVTYYSIRDQFDPYTLLDLIQQGLLKREPAQNTVNLQENNLAIFNYTRKATYENALKNHPEARLLRQCRGVILSEGSIYALPWSKFFNYGEPGCPDIPATAPLITKKYDGVLGILFCVREKTFWTTRGNLESEQGKIAQQMWGDRPSSVVPFGWTIMAEIIHPSTKVIVDYDFEGLVVLGARNILTEDEIPFEQVADWASSQNLRMAERIEGTFEEALSLVANMDAQQEGFVLAWPPENGGGEWTRVKVKSKDYIRVHRILSNLSDFRIGSLWYFGKLHEIPIDIPEEFSLEISRIREELEKSSFEIEREIASAFSQTVAATGVGPSAKEFSSKAKEIAGEWFSPVMNFFRGKKNDERLLAFKKKFGRAPSED